MAWDFIDKGIKKASSDGKAVFRKIKTAHKKEELDNFFYLDEKWNGNTQAIIKITNKTMLESIKRRFASNIDSENKSKGYFVVVQGNFKAKFNLSGGTRGSGRLDRAGVKTSNPTTAQQESGTIFAIEYYGKNKKLPTLREVGEHVGYMFSQEWEHNFHRHALLVAEFVGLSKISTYDVLLDSKKIGRHNLLFDRVSKLGMSDLKDNWNPSDIWLIRKTLTQAKMTKELGKFNHYGQVNAWLESMFDSKQLVGVSLKKIETNSKGVKEIISVRNAHFEETFEPKKVKFNPTFANFILESLTHDRHDFMVRTGFKSASSSVSVYLEGRMKGTSVQLGAVSAKLFAGLSKEYSDYSTTGAMKSSEKFTDQRNKELLKMASKLKTSKIFNFDGASEFESTLDEIKAGDSVDADKLLRRIYNLTLFAAVFDSAHRKGNYQKLVSSAYYSAKKQNKFSSIHLKVH